MSNKTHDEEDFCEIYVFSMISPASFARRLSKVMGGDCYGEMVESSRGKVEVEVNPFRNLFRALLPTDSNFISFPLVLDVVPSTSDSSDAIRYYSDVLTHVWNMGYSAIAACSNESDLPKQGGALTSHQWGWLAWLRKPREPGSSDEKEQHH